MRVLLANYERDALVNRVKKNIDEAYQHSIGRVSMWFTHADITHRYVITLDTNKAGGVGTVVQIVMDEPDKRMEIDDLAYVLNELYDEYEFRLLAHAFGKKTLSELREKVHAHIREDIVV